MNWLKNLITFLLISYEKYFRVNIYLHKNKLYFILSLMLEVILVKLYFICFLMFNKCTLLKFCVINYNKEKKSQIKGDKK